MAVRNVIKLINGVEATDGGNIKIARFLSGESIYDCDPFLRLDVYKSAESSGSSKDWTLEPCRGIEQITYLMKGSIRYDNNRGKSGEMKNGDLLWLTAGSGVMFNRNISWLGSLQAVNIMITLPRNSKMVDPSLHLFHSNEIPIAIKDGMETRIISGEYEREQGPHPCEHVKFSIFDIDLKPGAIFEWDCPVDETVIAYVFDGCGSFGESDEQYDQNSALLFDHHCEFFARASASGMRVILLCGSSQLDHIHIDGAIAMNSQEEIADALEDIQLGEFDLMDERS